MRRWVDFITITITIIMGFSSLKKRLTKRVEAVILMKDIDTCILI